MRARIAASTAGTASCTICPAGKRANTDSVHRVRSQYVFHRSKGNPATQTKRRLQDRVNATRASPASSLATMDTHGAPGWERPHTQMLCSLCSPGHVIQASAHPAKGERPNTTSKAHHHDKVRRCPAGSSAPKIAKQARTQIPSAQRRSKKAFTARADVASSVHQDLTALLE